MRAEPESQGRERRDGAVVCQKCGSPAFETHRTSPWGSQERLLVCLIPAVAQLPLCRSGDGSTSIKGKSIPTG
jgi:hypothetical protein